MAYFERADERDPLILCNICNVKCAERSLTSHRFKCASRHPEKFTSGQLKKCEFDTGHIIKADMYELHLEFCTKYQAESVAEWQHELEKARKSLLEENSNIPEPPVTASSVDDDWNRIADSEPFIRDMSELNINGTK